jgi:hypothetical protein
MIPLDIAAQQSLISAASAGFGPSKKAEYVKVLRFLAENSGRDRRRERTRGIRLVLPEDYGVDLSTYLKRIQHLLDKFFDSPPGQQHEHRIRIVIGRPGEHHPDLYDLRFPLNTNSLVKRFWVMDATAETFIVYGLPLFVRESGPVTFRRIADRNLEAKEPPGTDVRFPFVAHGDLLAAVALTELFTSQHVAVRLGAFKAQHTVKHLLKETPRSSDAVILGSVRVSGILEEYQSTHVLEASDGQPARYLPFRLRIHDVVRMDDDGHEVGEPYAEETGLHETVVPVVITRRRGKLEESDVTLIASNHGMAVYRAVQVLTDSGLLRQLFDHPRLRPWEKALPRVFQILLKIVVLNDETKATSVTVEDIWALDAPGAANSSTA